MKLNWSRRGFLGTLTAIAGSFFVPPRLLGAKPAQRESAASLTGFGQSGDPYQELGVATVINAEGTMTMLGGSLIRAEVEAVMAQAARHFVSIPGLEAAAGKRIAQMLKLPEGYSALVTSGAAGAIQSGLAGILTGDNESFIKQLPDLTGMKSEAADTPPVSHLWDYADMGYDLVTFSGGKVLRGPQCAGLLIGREDLVHFALLNNSPYEDTLGRGQKVGKEEIVGMIKALELYLNEDHDALAREWQQRLDTVSRQITKIPGVSTSFFTPDIANHVPHMQITWDAKISLTPQQVSQTLRAGQPSIVIGGGEGRPGLAMSSFMLQPGEEQIIADQLVKVLREHSA